MEVFRLIWRPICTLSDLAQQAQADLESVVAFHQPPLVAQRSMCRRSCA